MTNDECTVNADTWYDYKIIYDPQTGKIKVYQNNILVSQWTDNNPLQIGDYISLRTGNAIVDYDDIRVYYQRDYSIKYFSVSTDTSAMVHYDNIDPDKPALLISSIITDSTGNFSAQTDKFINVDFTAPQMIPPVNDGTSSDIDTLYDNNMIAANWAAAYDNNDSIDNYFVAVGSQPFQADIIAWHNAGTSTLFDSTGLTLNFDSTYYTSVFCKNKAGLISDTICSDGVTVINPTQPPHADFYSGDTAICVGDTVQFYSTSTYTAGYLWIFEGGTPYYSIQANPQVTYSNPGYYDVTLIVTNEIGSDTLVVNNLIYVEGKPIAQFSATPTQGAAPLQVNFNNSSSNSYFYHWDFGDGTTSSEINPIHTYNVVSTYDVILIAGNNSCPADTLIKQNYITVITDINETDYNLSVTAFPVPAHNYITLKTENNSITAIKIINHTGKEIISLPYFHLSKTIDIKQLTPGIYFILLFDADNKQLGTLKIIKH
jgi:PKD repeat protein